VSAIRLHNQCDSVQVKQCIESGIAFVHDILGYQKVIIYVNLLSKPDPICNASSPSGCRIVPTFVTVDP
jgi:hypothetical protein